MINSKLLKSKMGLYGDNNESLAEALGISRQTLSAKIKRNDFRQSEIKIIILRYDLTLEETHQMFFD